MRHGLCGPGERAERVFKGVFKAGAISDMAAIIPAEAVRRRGKAALKTIAYSALFIWLSNGFYAEIL
ncbi:MAG: hypothetical protein KBG58_00115 [Giesbergeria sp.]|nr:hypothetical protein [Giesbergeria sp.]